MKCHYKSERQERMMDLTVEIEGNIGKLEDALRRFTSAEILDGDNKYQCGRFVSLCFLIKLLNILFVRVYSSTCFFSFFLVCVCVGWGVGAQQERTISTFLSKHVFKLSSAVCWLFVLTKILYCSGTLQT
jgi:hypothetical protein